MPRQMRDESHAQSSLPPTFAVRQPVLPGVGAVVMTHHLEEAALVGVGAPAVAVVAGLHACIDPSVLVETRKWTAPHAPPRVLLVQDITRVRGVTAALVAGSDRILPPQPLIAAQVSAPRVRLHL